VTTELNAIHFWHGEIRDYEIGRPVSKDLQRHRAIDRSLDFITLLGQSLP
jgi:hypothetical protein